MSCKGKKTAKLKNGHFTSSLNKKPDWDASISDLSSYKLTPQELAARKARLSSSNIQAVKRLSLLQKINNARRMGGAKGGVVREVLPICNKSVHHSTHKPDNAWADREATTDQYPWSDNGDEEEEEEEDEEENEEFNRDEAEGSDEVGRDRKVLKQLSDISKLPSLVLSLHKSVQKLEEKLIEERRSRQRLQGKLSAVVKTCEDLKKQLQDIQSAKAHPSTTNPPSSHLSTSHIPHSTVYNSISDHAISSLSSPLLPTLPSSSLSFSETIPSMDLTPEEIEKRLHELTAKQTQTYEKLQKLNQIKIN